VTPDGQLKTSLENQTSTNTLNQLKQNPIINTAIDTANATITTVVQQSVRNAITKINLTPIQNATTQFFTLFASVTSFGTEVAMAFARNTGNNLITALAQKDAVSVKLEAEIVALYNACTVLLNGQPFFTNYLTNVAKAYGLIQTADNNLKNVAAKLAPNTLPSPRYQTLKFNLSITQLTQARDLLLPDTGTDVSNIRAGTLVSQALNSQSVKQVYAAALAIPGISLQVATLALQYEILSVNVNAYINTFQNALNDYITGYTQSNAVNQATIDHINSGTSQLDNLLAQMNAILSLNTGAATDVKFKIQLSSYGTIWGVTLTAIIEWLKMNPGAGSALLTQTSASVAAYTKARNQIMAMGNRTVPGGGTVFINQGSEDAFAGLVRPLAKFMTTANLIVATSNSKNDVRAQAKANQFYLQTARKGDAALVAALQPFLNTQTTLSGPVNAALQQMIGLSNKLGLDRIAGLLTNGDVKNLFAATPANATYAGAAIVGINSIITNLSALPNATSQQISNMESLRTQVQREQTAQATYAGRSAASTQQADIAQQQAKVATNKTLVTAAQRAAAQIDGTVSSDPVVQSSDILSTKVTPGQLPDAPDTTAQLNA
jgi:hypothetical protein